jgi:hypothetical protein
MFSAKSICQLLAKRCTHSKPLIALVVTSLAVGGFFIYSFAFAIGGVTVTPASNGNNISIDTTSTSGGTGVYKSLTGPTITENIAGSIKLGTHIITLPSGWEFKTSSLVTVGIGGGDIEVQESETGITPNLSSFSFNVTKESTSPSPIMFFGLKVRPTGTVVGTGNITYSGIGITGVDASTNFGTLTTIAGTPTQLKVETQANGSGAVVGAQSLSSGSSLTAYAIERDQFNNFAGNVAVAWSLTGKSGGVLDGDLVANGDNKSAVLTGNIIGAATIHAAGSFFADSGVITVIPGPVSAGNSTVEVSAGSAVVSSGGNIITITVTVKDAAGNVIPGATVVPSATGSNNFIILSSDITNASGIAIFTISSTKAEGKTISATANDTLITQTQGVTFNHDVASNLIIQTQPSASATAGVVFVQQPVIQIVDQFGNLINEDDTTVVTATRNGGSGSRVLLGTLTATAVDGVAIFTDLKYEEAATIKIDFSSGILAPATADNIVVAPNIPAVVTFTIQPASIGTVDNILTTQPIVGVVDAYSNNVADGTNVVLSLNSGAGALRGTLTRTTSGGAATFNDIGYNKVDEFSIAATAGTVFVVSDAVGPLTAGIINAFTLSADTSQTAGVEFLVSVSGAVDQYGNPASGAVTVSAASGGGDSPSGAHPTFGAITVMTGTGSVSTILVNAVATVLHGLVGSVSDDTDAITVNPADASQVVVTSSESAIDADGSDSANITGQLKDQYGNNKPQAGVSITLTTTKGTLAEAGAQLSDVNGKVTTTLTSGADRTAGTANVSAVSGALTIVPVSVTMIDVTPPAAPVITTPASSPVVINIANKPTQVLSGTAEAGSTVKIYVDSAPTLITTTATGSNFTFTNTQLQDAGIVSGADYSVAKVVTVTATDAALEEGAASNSISYTQDTIIPTFTIQYYSDSGLTTPLGDNSRLKAGTYYLKITSNEALGATPTVSINAEGTANDATGGATVSVSGNDYKYTRVVASDAAAVGTVLENISITGTDAVGNTATDVDPADEATKVAYTDTVAPTISSYTFNGSAANITFDPTDPASVSIIINASEIISNWVSLQVVQAGVTKKDYFPAFDNSQTMTEIWNGSLSAGGTAPDGVYTLEIHMIDRAGNEVDNVVLNTYAMTVDTQNPAIADFTAPATGAVYKNTIAVAFTPTDPAPGTALTCAYAVSDGPVGTFPTCISATPVSVTIPGASDGRHTLTITVTDAAGNYISSVSGSFVVDTNNTLTVGAIGADFTTIQEAITKSTVNDMINVAAGIYTETGQIVINKNLSIVGADKTTTIIKPAQDTTNTSHADSAAWILINSDKTFNLSNVTLDGSGYLIAIGILSHGHGVINNNIFTNIAYNPSGPDYKGMAIELYGSDATVSNNSFSNVGRIGVFSGFGANSTISGNTYTGKGAGNWLDYGFEVGRGSQSVITDNIVSGNIGVAAVDGSTSAGIMVTSYFGPGTSGATITGNTITNCDDGIAVGYDASDASVVIAHTNKFSGNTFGISSTNPTVNATQNWWGSDSGPTHATLNPHGTGDAISDDVTYVSWCTNETCSPYDTTAPAATLSGTPVNPTHEVSGTINVGGTDVIYYKYNLDGVGYSAEIVASTPITYGPLGNGSHNVLIIGRDLAGNWQAEGSATTYTWTIDTGAPTTAITSPTGGSYNSDISITATASDASGIDRVEFWHSSADTLISTDAEAPYTAVWNSVGAAEGSHTIYVKAYDEADNMTQSDSVAVVIDRTVPVTTLAVNPVAPNGTNDWYTSAPTLTLTCADQVGLSGCHKIYSKWDDAVSYAEYSAPISALEGTHTLHYYSTDNAGNPETPIASAAIKVDTTHPVLVLGSLFTDQTLTGGRVYYINWTSSDLNFSATPIKLEYSIDGGTTWLTIIANTENDGTYAWSVPTRINSSAALIKITATDLAGNTSAEDSNEFTIAYSEETDVTPPVVTLSSPNGGESYQVGSSQVVTWTATDTVTPAGAITVKLEYSTDGSAHWTEIIASTENDGAYLWTVPVGVTANALVKVTATDAAANAGADISNAVFAVTAAPVHICNETAPGSGQWTCAISLSAGWNLVSLPVIIDDTDIEDVIAGISDNLREIRYYENEDWQNYMPGWVEDDLVTIEDGKGYWINMDDADTLTVTGTKAPASPEPSRIYSVSSGWNLIGFKSTITQIAPTYLGTLSAGSYTLLNASSENKTTGFMDAGKGYWLWMNAAGSIVTYSETE